MSLEPVTIDAETGHDPELHDMSRRLWIALALTAPVLVTEMGGHVLDLDAFMSAQTRNWIQLVVATPVVFWAGWPFFTRAVAFRSESAPEHAHDGRDQHRYPFEVRSFRRLGVSGLGTHSRRRVRDQRSKAA